MMHLLAGDGPLRASEGALHVVPGPKGNTYYLRQRIAFDDALAADSVNFSMRNKDDATHDLYVQWIRGSLGFFGTAAASDAGVYFDRFSAANHSAGTSILANVLAADGESQPASQLGNARFRTGLLTETNVVYEGAPVHGISVPRSVTGRSTEFFLPFMGKGLKLQSGGGTAGVARGLCMRLAAASVVGDVIDLTVCWVEG